jgi:hypothetical protein
MNDGLSLDDRIALNLDRFLRRHVEGLRRVPQPGSPPSLQKNHFTVAVSQHLVDGASDVA